MLRDLTLQPFYSRDNCPDLVEEFFVPTLSHSIRYDRATFTFSPEALSVAAAGLAGLIQNGGAMRLICHHELRDEVVTAILDGQRAAEDAILDSLVDRGLTDIDGQDLVGLHHLKLLTWLVKEGRLDIKVAIPKQEKGLFHHKIGVFTDIRGDGVAFNGSLNESRHGWLLNDESMSVFNTWESEAHFMGVSSEFERLWENRSESSLVVPIPEALRRNLIEYAPERPPDRPDRGAGAKGRALLKDELWAAIAHAVRHDPQTTIETVATELWPHQRSFWRRYGRDEGAPPRVLIADEVGLGKTIQAGSVLKTIVNRGQADRVLILTPAVARWQWQQELRHKFNVEIPVLDRSGGQLQLASSDGSREAATNTPWRENPRLILSYDWLRRNVDRYFEDDPRYDLVIFDEAHHARYSNVNNPRRRRDNSYLRMLRRLSSCTQGLMLLTATPMQIDPSELWALLQPLQEGGQWTEDEFRRFYDIGAPSTLSEWDAARQLYLRGGPPGSPEQIAELARMTATEAREHLDYICMPSGNAAVLRRDMTEERIRDSVRLMRRSSSIKRSVSRHTRNLLRQYAQEGRLSQTVPRRDVRPVAVSLAREDRELYDDVSQLVRMCYQGQGNVNQQALGFVMTHFRLRLGSSMHAFRRSLEDLREKMQTAGPEDVKWDALPIADGDEYSDLDPETEIPGPQLTLAGQQLLSDLIERCRARPGRDSKFTTFLAELARLRTDGYAKVMVFSVFRDTQEWLREQLASEGEEGLLAGLSGTEDWTYKPERRAFVAEARDKVVQQFRDRPEGVLLCTETAAESLNFQFCSAIINYDIPWNPMRLEQRIGRIDRIGQAKPIVRVVHLFYRNTVEYDAYTAMEARIQEFEEHVGTLQPILAANLESLIRGNVMEGREPWNVRQAVRDLEPTVGFDLDDLAAAAADEQDPSPCLHMNDLTYILNHPEWLPDGYGAVGRGRNHWRVTTPDGGSRIVTTVRAAHDSAAGTVEFFGPGSPAFPDIACQKDRGSNDGESLPRSIPEILAADFLGMSIA